MDWAAAQMASATATHSNVRHARLSLGDPHHHEENIDPPPAKSLHKRYNKVWTHLQVIIHPHLQPLVHWIKHLLPRHVRRWKAQHKAFPLQRLREDGCSAMAAVQWRGTSVAVGRLRTRPSRWSARGEMGDEYGLRWAGAGSPAPPSPAS